MDCVRQIVTPSKLTQEDFLSRITERPNEIFSSGNSKMKRTKYHAWSIPAFRGAVCRDGELKIVRTCPQAGQCAKWCFAQMGTFSFSNTMIKHAKNLQWVLDDRHEFQVAAVEEIMRRPSIKTVRIHDSGDFFSWSYMMMWFDIMNHSEVKNRGVRFYAYTKMVSLVKHAQRRELVPSNMRFIFSYGGREDHLIDPTVDRHSKVFRSQEDCDAAGYHYLGDDDSLAAYWDELKVGLVFHAPCAYKKRINNVQIV